MRPRANAVQMERRLTLVRQMLAGGLTHGDIARFASRTWGVGRVQAWRYIRRAYGEPEKLEEEESRMQGALAVRARNAEFRRALREGKYREALRALESRDMIFGILDERGRRGRGSGTTKAQRHGERARQK